MNTGLDGGSIAMSLKRHSGQVATSRSENDDMRLHALDHMQSLLMELRRNARSQGLLMLGYFLDMAVAEIKETRETNRRIEP